MALPRLIHLNGPPGIGKSTIARRYAADHPGVLNLDVDRLRSFIGGVGFLEAGEIVRPLGAALMTTHLAGGRDVVYPQLASDPAEVAGVERATRDGGGEYVGIVLTADAGRRRTPVPGPAGRPSTPWLDEVREIVEGLGGDDALRTTTATCSSWLRPAATPWSLPPRVRSRPPTPASSRHSTASRRPPSPAGHRSPDKMTPCLWTWVLTSSR